MASDGRSDASVGMEEDTKECCEETSENDNCPEVYLPCPYDDTYDPMTVAGVPVPKGLEKFPPELFFQYNSPEKHLGGFALLPLYQTQWSEHVEKQRYCLENNHQLANKWDTFRDNYPNSLSTTVLPTAKDFHFTNGYVQYEDPASSARPCNMSMRSGPLLDHTAQLPIPGNDHRLYRAGNVVNNDFTKNFRTNMRKYR